MKRSNKDVKRDESDDDVPLEEDEDAPLEGEDVPHTKKFYTNSSLRSSARFARSLAAPHSTHPSSSKS